MNSKFKSFMALSLAVLVFSADARTVRYNNQETQTEDQTTEIQEQVSNFGTKSKVALAVLATTVVAYGVYNREALKEASLNAYNACTKENFKAFPGKAKDLAVSGYNACTLENGKAVVNSAKEAVVTKASALKELTVTGYNACTLENGKAGFNSAKDAVITKASALKDFTANACNSGFQRSKSALVSTKDSVVNNSVAAKNWLTSFFSRADVQQTALDTAAIGAGVAAVVVVANSDNN